MENSPPKNPFESLDRLIQSAQSNLPAKALVQSTRYAIEESPVPGSMEIVAKVSNQIKCDRCNALNLPTANFCRDCGAPMAKICICPACQTPGRQGDEFCHHCGHQLPA